MTLSTPSPHTSFRLNNRVSGLLQGIRHECDDFRDNRATERLLHHANYAKRKLPMTSTSPKTRYLGTISIGLVIAGSILSLFLLTGPSHGTMPGIGGYQKIFALFSLWVTNLLTLILNAIYFFYVRKPRWLKIILLLQLTVALIALLPLS